VEVLWRRRIDMTCVIAPLLRRAGIALSNKKLAAIRNSLRADFGSTPKYDVFPDLIRWEDEGGAVYVRPPWRTGTPA
jgi:hypothetical protein